MRKIIDILLIIILCGATGTCFGALIVGQDQRSRGIDMGLANLKSRGLQGDVIDSMAVVQQWINNHEANDYAQEERNKQTREAVQELSIQQSVMQAQYLELVRRMDDAAWWLRSLLIGVAAQLLASISWLIKTVFFRQPPQQSIVSIPCDQENCPYTSGKHRIRYDEGPEG